MNYHPNSVYMQSSRPPSHGYSYAGPAATGKSPAAGAPQANAASPGYGQMYVFQPSTSPYTSYQPGTEGKYPGAGRGVGEVSASQVLMASPGIMYPGQHISSPGPMILQGGQQIIMGPSQMYQPAPGGHQPRLHYPPPSQPTGNQYGIGIAQPQPQQPYYKGGYIPNQSPSQQPSAVAAAPKRERKILQIVNPDTGKAVNLTAEQGLPSVANDAEPVNTTAAAAAENASFTPQPMTNIAAQFAAQVAATLNTSASSFQAPKPTLTNIATEDNSARLPTATAQTGTKPTLPSDATVLEKPVSCPSVQPDSEETAQLDSAPKTLVESSSLAISNSFPSDEDKISSPLAGVVPAPENSEASDAQNSPVASNTTDGPLPAETSPADEVTDSKDTKNSIVPAVVDVPQQPSALQQSRISGTVAGSAVPEAVPAAATISDNGNKKKNRKKEKSTDCDSALIPLLCVHG